MRIPAFLMLILALPAVGSATPLNIDFRPPGQASPELGAETADWALVLFRHPGTSVHMVWPTGAEGSNVTVQRIRAEYLGGRTLDGYTVELPGSDQFGPLDFQVDFNAEGDWASMYIEGDLAFHAGQALAHLQPYPDGTCASKFLNVKEFGAQPARAAIMCPPGDQAVVALRPAGTNASMPFWFKSTSTQTAEWHNAQTECQGHCPQGGRRERTWQSLAPNASLAHETRAFERLSGPGDATVAGQGNAAVILLGARSLNLSVNGWLRLPLAEGTSCEGCPTPTGNTLQATGALELRDLRMGPDGDLVASLDGDYESIRFDEASIDPALLRVTAIGAAAVVVAGGGLYILVKTLIGFFTRVHPTRAQENPRRKAIRNFIAAHPGAGFNEILRGTSIASGSLRRHLEVLKLTGHIEEARQGRRRRFHVAATNQKAVLETVLMREIPLAKLYELVERNPWLSQGELMDLAERELAYSRSTTQHRLGRLLKAGLLQVQRRGRFLLHATSQANWNPNEGS